MIDDPHDKLRNTLFSVRMSVRYHRSRQSFFEFWSKVFRGLSMLAAMSVFTSSMADAPSWVATTASAIITLSVLFDSVVDPSRKSSLHGNLANEFAVLEGQILSRFGEYSEVNEATSAYFAQARLTIETKEPPSLTWLILRSRNEQIVAQNSPEHPEIVRIPWLQSRLIHFVDIWSYGNGGRKQA